MNLPKQSAPDTLHAAITRVNEHMEEIAAQHGRSTVWRTVLPGLGIVQLICGLTTAFTGGLAGSIVGAIGVLLAAGCYIGYLHARKTQVYCAGLMAGWRVERENMLLQLRDPAK